MPSGTRIRSEGRAGNNLEAFNLEALDLPNLFKDVSRRFRNRNPSAREFEAFVKKQLANFIGPEGLIALIALLFSIWTYYFGERPHAQSEFVCDKMFGGDRCKMGMVKTERQDDKIYIWCKRGHETVIPIQRQD